LGDTLEIGSYLAADIHAANGDKQLEKVGVHSALAVPFMGASGKASILLVCNRRPFAKHEAKFLSYDGELCRLYAERIFGADGAAYASTEEDYQTQLTRAAREVVVCYDSLWRRNGVKPFAH
jgi:hypothetical protein